MTQDPDEDRIRRKAHELWVAEGHPHGRDQSHWDEAKEIIAIEDSMAATLLPRDTGAEEPEEPTQAVENLGDLPNLTDQGEHALTDTSREPSFSVPETHATGDTVGAVARPKQEPTPDIDDAEIASTPVKPQPVSGKPAAAVTTPVEPPKPASAPIPAAAPAPVAAPSAAAAPATTPVQPPLSAPAPAAAPVKTAPKTATSAVSMVKVSKPKASRKKKG